MQFDIFNMETAIGDSHLDGDDYACRIGEFYVQDFKQKNLGKKLPGKPPRHLTTQDSANGPSAHYRRPRRQWLRPTPC